MHPTREWHQLLTSAPDGNIEVVGGRIYASSTLSEPRVYALSLATGDLLWEHPSDFSIQGGVAVADNQVYYGDDSGTFYAADCDTGKIEWTAESEAAGEFLDPDSGMDVSEAGLQLSAMFSKTGQLVGTPAVDDSTVFVNSFDGHLYAFDTASGDRCWMADPSGRFGVGISPVIHGETVITATTEGEVIAVDRVDGSIHWQTTIDDGVYSSPIVVEDTVFIVPDGELPFLGFDVATGDRTVTGDFVPSGQGTPDPDRSALYLPGTDRVVALDLEGTIMWERSINCRTGTRPIFVDDLVIVGGGTEEPYVRGLAAETGEAVFEIPVERFASVVEYCSAGLLVGDGEESLQLYDLE